MVIFKFKQKKFGDDCKKPIGLYPTNSVKYLGVKIDRNLTWHCHVNDISIKLNRTNNLLSKVRNYISMKTLRSFYFANFKCYLSYCTLVWAQNCSTIYRKCC